MGVCHKTITNSQKQNKKTKAKKKHTHSQPIKRSHNSYTPIHSIRLDLLQLIYSHTIFFFLSNMCPHIYIYTHTYHTCMHTYHTYHT